MAFAKLKHYDITLLKQSPEVGRKLKWCFTEKKHVSQQPTALQFNWPLTSTGAWQKTLRKSWDVSNKMQLGPAKMHWSDYDKEHILRLEWYKIQKMQMNKKFKSKLDK